MAASLGLALLFDEKAHVIGLALIDLKTLITKTHVYLSTRTLGLAMNSKFDTSPRLCESTRVHSSSWSESREIELVRALRLQQAAKLLACGKYDFMTDEPKTQRRAPA